MKMIAPYDLSKWVITLEAIQIIVEAERRGVVNSSLVILIM
jgi:hypothetical protein